MTEPLIQVTGLTMGWDDVVLQKDATFHVDRGEVFAILGGSGCGKSTLLRNLVGLETPMAGEISIAGVGHPNLDAGRPPFGVMFQGGALFGSLTVGENVGLQLEEWTELPHEECPMAAAIKDRQNLNGGGQEAVVERPDGTRVPFMAFPSILRDSAGKVVITRCRSTGSATATISSMRTA